MATALTGKTAQKYIVYRDGCKPFDLCSSEIFFLAPVSVTDSVYGPGFYSLQENLGGVDYTFQSSLVFYPQRLYAPTIVWRLEAWSVAQPAQTPTWTTDFSLPWRDISDQCLTVMNMDKDLLASVSLTDFDHNVIESAEFRLPRNLVTPLRNYYLALLGVSKSSATFDALTGKVSYNNDPDVTDMLAFALPEAQGNPFPCNPSFNSSEGTNATQTPTVLQGNAINVDTDLRPWVP